MGERFEIQVRPSHPGVGLNTRTVCEMLGWRMAVLIGHVRAGSLPPPGVWGGELVWPMDYVRRVRADGLRLPGTYPGFPPGVDADIELSRWVLVGRSRDIRYTARQQRAAVLAAKRKRGGQ